MQSVLECFFLPFIHAVLKLYNHKDSDKKSHTIRQHMHVTAKLLSSYKNPKITVLLFFLDVQMLADS